MALSISQAEQLAEIRRLAEEQGKEDVVAKADALLQADEASLRPQDLPDFVREGAAEREAYNKNKERSEQLSEIITLASEKGKEDVMVKAQQIKSLLDKDIFDYEDITEEIRGAGSAALEAVSGGFLGDEAQAWMLAGITGADYDAMLEDTRRIQQEFAEDMPILDAGIRIAAGILPSARLAKAVGVGKSFTSGVLRQGGLAEAEMAAYSFMEGEGGVEERLTNVAETLTDPLSVGVGLLAGGLGGFGGKAVSKAEALERSIEDAILQEEKKLQRLRTGKDETVGTDVITETQQATDNAVLRFYNMNGRMPEGTEITQVYKEASEELGVPLSRIMQSEMKAGAKRTDLDYRNQSIVDVRKRVQTSGEFVSDLQARQERGGLFGWKDFYEDKFEPLVNVVKRRVGEKAGGNVQRMATAMARQQQQFDTVFNTEPVQAFARALEKDTGIIKQRILNFSNSNLDKSVRSKEFADLKKLLTKEQMEGLRALLRLRIDQAKNYRSSVFGALPVDPLYLPSRTLEQVKEAQIYNRRNMPRRAVDTNMMERTRGYVTKEEALEYENPLVILRDKMALDESLIQLHQKFKLDNISSLAKKRPEEYAQLKQQLEEGEASFFLLRKALGQEGASDVVADKADEFVRSLIVRGTKGPDNWISNVRKLTYMGTIGNPYSALLNFGDVSNTVVNFGADNTGIALANMLKKEGIKVGVEDVGLINQASGEFLREGSSKWNRRFNKLSDVTFKYSGFQAADVAGKTVTLNAAVQRGRQMAVDGTLMREYDWLFNKRDLAKLRQDLLTNTKTDRVREFAAAELAKLQPSDLAQMPKWYLDHPNGRILYMLRTFGIKQLQQIERLVLQTWKEGVKRNDNKLKAEAIKNAAAYVTVVGGGNVLLNELRQPLKGREAFDEERMKEYFVDYMLGLATINTASSYNLKKLGEGDAVPLVLSVFPASVSMAKDFAGDIGQVATDKKDLEDIFFTGKSAGWLPFMRVAQPFLEEEFY